jgi:hypothetical protein
METHLFFRDLESKNVSSSAEGKKPKPVFYLDGATLGVEYGK